MISQFERDIIETLKRCIGYDAPLITQQQFDEMVEHIINNETTGGNYKELLWRLCGCYVELNFNKVIDDFVDNRDYYYTSELVSFVHGNLDQEYLTNKMLATDDVDFIKKSLESCGGCMESALSDNYLKLLKDKIQNTK